MKKLLLLFPLLFLLSSCIEETLEEEQRDPSALVASINDDTLSWNSLGEGFTYDIYSSDITYNNPANNQNKLASLVLTTYPLTDLLENHLYSFFVVATKEGVQEIVSNVIQYQTFIDSDIELTSSYNIHSENDFAVLITSFSALYSIEVAYQQIQYTSNFTNDSGLLMIDKELFNDLDDSIELTLYTDQGIVTLTVSKEDVELPYMRSENTITFTDKDLVFILELAGGDFIEINGSEIDDDGFTLSGNILTINEDFISSLFTANPDRSTVILSYQLKKGDEFVIGYLFIEKE